MSQNREVLTDMLTALCAIYRKKLTTELIDLYDRALSDLTEDEVIKAGDYLFKNLDQFPKPTEFRAVIARANPARFAPIPRAAPVGKMIEGQWVYQCWLCEDSGYQTLEETVTLTYRGGPYQTTQLASRPCSCEAAPSRVRSQIPLEPPDWKKDQRGVWRKVEPENIIDDRGWHFSSDSNSPFPDEKERVSVRREPMGEKP